MEVFEFFRKAMLAGFGVQDKVRELVDDLVKKGELSKSEGAKFVREMSEKAQKSTEDLNKTFQELIRKSLDRMNVPSKEEIEHLNKDIKSLSAKIKKLEDKLEQKT